jgi:hypothetical protein
MSGSLSGSTGWSDSISDGCGRSLKGAKTLGVLSSLQKHNCSLYKGIKLDEPWNGPNNRRFNALRPPIFGCPSHPESGAKGYTDYVAVVGPRTLFPGAGKGRN